MEHTAIPQPHVGRSAARFLGIGLALYAVAWLAAERLLYRTGDTNPVYKIETAEAAPFDWVILGASHAMPLDFDGFEAVMEAETGLAILNLAGPGTGPLYNRFVLEHFLRGHETTNILYVVDSFAFRAPTWNEERLSDPKLIARTPFSPALAIQLGSYVLIEGVDPRALLDYVTGFSKLNNRDRFRRDVWEGEASFDRAFKPSASAERKRVDYLYPPVKDESEAAAGYLADLAGLIDLAGAHGATVSLAKFPLPARFAKLLPDKVGFDADLRALAETRGVALLDFTAAVEEPRLYADTDHLNRDGVTAFFEEHLKPVLLRGAAAPSG